MAITSLKTVTVTVRFFKRNFLSNKMCVFLPQKVPITCSFVCFRENSWRQLARQHVHIAMLLSHTLFCIGNMCINTHALTSANSVRSDSKRMQAGLHILVLKV